MSVVARRARTTDLFGAPPRPDFPDNTPPCGCCWAPTLWVKADFVRTCACNDYEHRCLLCGRCPEHCCKKKAETPA